MLYLDNSSRPLISVSGLGVAAFGIKDEEDKLPTLGLKRTGRFRIGTSQNSRFRMLVAFRSLISNKDNKRAREDARPNVATVFMILPPDRLDTYLRWLQLLAAQAISEMARSSAKPPRPVQFLLDEPEPVETRSGPYRIAFGSGMNEEGYSLAPD